MIKFKKIDKDNLTYVDIAKFIAMIAVMIQHTSTKYVSGNFQHIQSFCVCLFILCSGITTYISISKKNNVTLYTFKRIFRLLETYVISSMICFIIWNDGFDTIQYLSGLIHFSIQAPYYYLLVYIELVLISPFLYKLLQRFESKKRYTVLFIIFVISILLNRFKLFEVILGGGYLFGGTYLFIYFIGMVIGSKHHYINDKRKLLVFGIIETAILLLFIYVINNGTFNFKENDIFGSNNPPGLIQIFYSLLILFLIYTIDCLRRIYISEKLSTICFLGKHTLYVFLFHYLILNDTFVSLTSYLVNKEVNIVIVLIIVYLLTYVLSMVIEIIIESFINLINKIINIDCIINKFGKWRKNYDKRNCE